MILFIHFGAVSNIILEHLQKFIFFSPKQTLDDIGLNAPVKIKLISELTYLLTSNPLHTYWCKNY